MDCGCLRRNFCRRRRPDERERKIKCCTKLKCVGGFGDSDVMMCTYVPLNVRGEAMEDVKSDSYIFPKVMPENLVSRLLAARSLENVFQIITLRSIDVYTRDSTCASWRTFLVRLEARQVSGVMESVRSKLIDTFFESAVSLTKHLIWLVGWSGRVLVDTLEPCCQ